MSESVKWTKEQQMAIDISGSSMLVSAAAGSGKTAVLVERVIKSILEKNIDIDKMLIATFTNAAAAEMRAKIADAIAKKIDQNPNDFRLQKQLTLLNFATITTIHSFCLDIIKNNFHILDLDPNFRVADETEAQLLKMEALDEILEKAYEDEYFTTEFGDLVDFYGGGKDDSGLVEIILQIYNFVMSLPFPLKWLNIATENFIIDQNIDLFETNWGKQIKNELLNILNEFIDSYKYSIDEIKKDEGLLNYLDAFEDEYFKLLNAKKALEKGFFDTANAFYDIEFKRLSPSKKDSRENSEKFKTIRNKVKETILKIKEDYFSQGENEIKRELFAIYPQMKCLSSIVFELINKYLKKKKEKNIVDFNDLEHFAIKILTENDESENIIPTKTAVELKDKFDEILIDEYQDSNFVQEIIFTSISRDQKNIFMVGDVKQSIYRFRNANPDLFLQKFNTFPETKGKDTLLIRLNKNFRSRENILSFVNFVFEMIMSSSIGDVEYTKNERLNYGANYNKNDENLDIELLIIDKKRDDYNETNEKENKNDIPKTQTQIEARLVANRILKLIYEEKIKVFDKEIGKERNAEFRDIVILLRATKDKSNIFMNELKNANIPVYADADSGYFNSIEVATIMSLLKIIDNPLQDIPLVGVLRSPIFNFNEDEIASIHQSKRDTYLFEAIKNCAKNGDDKCKNFIDTIYNFRQMSKYTGVDELLWHIYDKTGYYSFVSGLINGETRQANLNILFERARQFEQTSFKGLFYFISFIDKLIETGRDYGSAKILGENENVVKIMSIHKSKGLEFPIVFICDASKTYNMLDMTKKIIVNKELGIGPNFVNLETRISYPTFAKQAIKSKVLKESLSEEMRVLYVALTRAKEKLIISGSVNNLEKSIVKWKSAIDVSQKKLSQIYVSSARSYLDLICPCIFFDNNYNEIGINSQNSDIIISNNDFNASISVFGLNEAENLNFWQENPQNIGNYFEINIDNLDKNIYNQISERLSYSYPFENKKYIPSKISVTEIKNINTDDDTFKKESYLIEKPKFLSENEKLSSAEKGTALHLAMQYMDFNNINSIDDINIKLNLLKEKGFISSEQQNAILPEKIYKFFNSDIGKELLSSNKIYKEQRFFLEIDANEIYTLPNINNEKIIVQGIIDCFFETKDGICLIDFKTDFVDKNNINQIYEKYKSQILYYEKAISIITGKKVVKKCIYLFYIDEILYF